MADQPKLQLNKAGLQDFVDHQITPFKEGLNKIANDDAPEGVKIDSLLKKGKNDPNAPRSEFIYLVQGPLAIGVMASDQAISKGNILNSKLDEFATSISEIYEQQIKLFGDLHDHLNKTIQKLMDNQHESLEKIDGKSFIDALGPVPGDFQDTNGKS